MFLKILQIAIPFVWFGMVGAISFLEAPLKFRAPNVTLALGLGIGKIVFQTLNRIEIALALMMLAAFFFQRPAANAPLYVFAAICLVLLAQTVWLLPLLNARAEMIIADQTNIPPSNAHWIFVAFEAAKFVLLFVLGASLLRNSLRIE